MPEKDSTGSTFNHGDFTPANAFFWSSLDLSHFAGTDLGSTPYRIELLDATGKKATGYLAGVGAGETLGPEITLDGGLENWSTPTDAVDWAEYISGSSILNRDGTEQRSGTYCARLDVDISGNITYLTQNYTLVLNKPYRLAFYYKNSTTGKKARPDFRSNDASWLLRVDGTWFYGPPTYPDDCWIDCPNSNGVYSAISISFSPKIGYTIFSLYLAGESKALGSSIWYDDVSLKLITDPPATAVHIVSSLNGTTRNWTSIESGFDPNAIASWAIYNSYTIRQKIITTLDARLKAILQANGYATDVGKNVYDWRTEGLSEDFLPALIYRDVSCETEITGLEVFTHHLKIQIVIAATGSTSMAEIRKMLADINKAIGVDLSWGDLALLTERIGDESISETEEDKFSGCQTIVMITFRTRGWDDYTKI
jgi:hypothetical protein